MEVKVGNFKEVPAIVGLHDDGHVVLSCSACGKHLVDIWQVNKRAVDPRTGQPFVWKVQALCCYCGDKSFPQKAVGRLALGVAGQNIPGADPDEAWDCKLETNVCRIEMDGDTIIYHTKKAN